MKKILSNEKVLFFVITALVVVVSLIAGILSRPKAASKTPPVIEEPQLTSAEPMQQPASAETPELTLALRRAKVEESAETKLRTGILEERKTAGSRLAALSAARQRQVPGWSDWQSTSAASQFPRIRNQEMDSMSEDGSRGREAAMQSQQMRNLPLQKYRTMLEDRQPQEITPELQRHIERYKVVEDNQRVKISGQQQERMKEELFLRLPDRYRELFADIDRMKAEQLEQSRQIPPMGIKAEEFKELSLESEQQSPTESP